MEKLILIGGEQKHQSIKIDGICTCLTSSMGTGGGNIPMIVEDKVKRLGNLFGNDKGTGYAGNVWDKEYIAPTITTAQGGVQRAYGY